jgi:RNA polymerase sigma factor (sigma-70 family)
VGRGPGVLGNAQAIAPLRSGPTMFETSLAAAIPVLQTRCRALARNGLDPEDVVSFTLERAFRYAGSYDHEKPVLPWLHAIALRVSMSARPRGAAPEEPDGEPKVESLDPAEMLERESFSDRVETALVALSEGQRTALVLWGAMGYSVQEVADCMGVGTEAARSLIRRGVVAFRATFPPLTPHPGA